MADMNLDAELVVYARQSQAVVYLTVVSLTVLVYDYCLTFNREVRLVWKSNWGIGNIMFLLARYPTFVDVPLAVWFHRHPYSSPGKCLAIYTTTTWFTVFGIAMADGILYLRTYALYHGNKKFLAFLVSLYVVVVIAAIVVVQIFMRSMQFGEAPPGIRKINGCYAINGSKILFVAYFLIIFQQTVILLLTIYKVVKVARRSSSRLIKALYRDGAFYYVYILLISIGNIIVPIAGPVNLVDLLGTFQRVMHSVLAARVLLHVREMLHQDVGITIGTSIEFAQWHSINDTETDDR